MSKYLLTVNEAYRVDMEEESVVLIEELKADNSFELVGYTVVKKTTKEDEYFVVKVKKLYNSEKTPV